jgi:hypothetical protein
MASVCGLYCTEGTQQGRLLNKDQGCLQGKPRRQAVAAAARGGGAAGGRRWQAGRRRPGSLQTLATLGVPSAVPPQHPLCAHLSTCYEAVRGQEGL